MLCTNPFVQGVQVFGCGQCIPCRINKRRLWCHRIMLESRLHGDNAFVTLTYSEENVRRRSDGCATLDLMDCQKWMKRLRSALHPVKLRYFLVGEYGDETFRPHYHVALFGFKPCAYGYSGFSPRGVCNCVSCELVRRTWGLGHTSVGQLELHSAQYLAGYVVKKMTRRDDVRLQGRRPEFARMSLRPGIGADAMSEVGKVCLEVDQVGKEGDVPTGLRHGRRIMPLGRYLRGKLRETLGVKGGAKTAFIDAQEKEMLVMLEASKTDKEAVSLKKQVVRKNSQRVASMVARSKIYKGRKSL